MKKTILIVEDHAQTQLVIAAYLKKHQYVTTLAIDAREADSLSSPVV